MRCAKGYHEDVKSRCTPPSSARRGKGSRGSSETLADHLLALRPERLGARGVEGVGTHAAAEEARVLGRDDVGDVVIKGRS